MKWSTQHINEKEFGLQQFFDKHRYPLVERYHSLEGVGDVASFLHREIRMSHDVLFCYENSVFPRRDDVGGHGSLVFGVREDRVVVADPNCWERVYVPLEVLVESVRVHRDGDIDFGGFWVIE